MGEDPQLDLRIIGRQEQPAGPARDERLADLAAVLGAHRDILQVGVARAQPAGRGDALVERGVNAAVLGMHEPGERIEVGALELRELAMLQQQGGKRVLERQLLQNLLGRALLAAGRLLQRRQFQLVEEHLAELRARVDVERAAGQRVDLGLDRRDPLGELARQLPEPLDVDLHSGRLHPRQHGDQGPLQLGIQRPEPFVPHLGREDRLDPPGRVGVFAGVFGDPVDGDLVHPALVLPFADQVGDRNHRVVEQPLGQLVEVVVALAAFEQVAQDHRVGDGPARSTPARPSASMSYLMFWPTFSICGVAQDRAAAPRGSPPRRAALDPAGPRTGK